MRKYFYLVVAFTCSSFVVHEKALTEYDTSGKVEKEIILDIIDGPSNKDKSTDLSKYKNKDVEVFKDVKVTGQRGIQNQMYSVYFYHTIKGELNEASAHLITPNDYSKASITWRNDSTISVKLFNLGNKKSSSFDAWGFKGGGGMKMDH
jgi:hypothetical protein